MIDIRKPEDEFWREGRMPMINHINLSDANGQVYCCLRNRIVAFDQNHQGKFCKGCRMYNGNAGGSGVECLWDDIRETEADCMVVTDPVQEWLSNQQRRVQSLLAVWSGSDECAGGSEAAM
jgi:hypothetical protein